jgi:hypothetical protein
MSENDTASSPSGNGAPPGGSPASGDSQWTRRDFIYGSAAAAAGAVLLRRVPRSPGHPGAGAAGAAGHLRPLQGESGSFSFKQASTAASGTGSIALSLSSITPGSLLVATFQGMISDGGTLGEFTPNASGWQLAKSVPSPAGSADFGRVEIWYYPGTADSPGYSGTSASVTFTATDSSASCRGTVSEFTVPTGSNMLAVLDAVGEGAKNSGTTFSPQVASGNVQNSLGVAAAAGFFGQAVSGTWSGMEAAGYSIIRILGGTVVNPWGAWYDDSLSAGIQSVNPTLTVTGGTAENSWASAFAAFRGVVIQPVYLDGAEMITMAALDPTGQQLILAGDVEGLWRSADFGNNWQIAQDGIYMNAWRCNASVAWSEANPGEVYSCVGKDATKNDGGFLLSADGGVTWTMQASAQNNDFLNFQANVAGVVLPETEQDDQNRSVGHLIAQFSEGGKNYVCLATYNTGIAMATVNGATWSDWEVIALGTTDAGSNYYLRTLSLDPASSTGLYAGGWNYQYTYESEQYTTGGLYHIPNATSAPASWTQVALPSGLTGGQNATVSDLKVLGSSLYVTFSEGGADNGIYLYNPNLKGGPWFSLNGGLTNSAYGIWTALDGYVNSAGNHVIIAVCGSEGAQPALANYTNVVQIIVDPSTGAVKSTSDLTGGATLSFSTIPPNGQPWWHWNANYQNWLGGSSFGNGHVLVVPPPGGKGNPQIFVTGAAGFYVYEPASGSSPITWTLNVNGVPACSSFDIVTDPNKADHYVICGDDFPFIDVLGDVAAFNSTTAVTVAGPPEAPGKIKLETHYAVFDPRPSISAGGTTYKNVVYVGFGNKYGNGTENANGEIYWIDSTEHTFYPTSPENGTNFAATVGGDVPTGLYAYGSSSSGYYLMAATIGSGVWQAKIPSNPTLSSNWSWTSMNAGTACSSPGATVQQTPFVANAAGTVVYLFDRAGGSKAKPTGIWRYVFATNTWTLIWNLSGNGYNLSVTDIRSGWLAVNPHPKNSGDELWVSTSQGIYKLIGADTKSVVAGTLTPTPMSSSSNGNNFFPNGAGSIVFTASSATLYAVSLSGPNAPSSGQPAQTSTSLLTLANNASPDNWADADPANSFGSYVSWPGPSALTVASSGKQNLLIGNQPNFGVYLEGITS